MDEKNILRLKLPWLWGTDLLCTAGYGPDSGSPYHDDKHNAFYALDFDKPWRGNMMPVVPILAVEKGNIVTIETNPEHPFGCHVVINHGGGYKSLYAHLMGMPDIPDLVRQGQLLGYMGETGHAQGPHLHFQLFFRNLCREKIKRAMPARVHILGVVT
ncbi:MAG: peptidase family protein [Parcubacteria group bacterium Licking1014_17]|nr:MAG: peptidase family protein [Parcubacteria group bacterium Licking1014_17]